MNGYAVGVSFSELFDGCVGDNSTRFELDISQLLPGKYYLELILMDIDANGVYAKHDVVYEALKFEVVVPENRPVFYSSNVDWGFFELPSTKVNCY